jgi:hypothetical protein
MITCKIISYMKTACKYSKKDLNPNPITESSVIVVFVRFYSLKSNAFSVLHELYFICVNIKNILNFNSKINMAEFPSKYRIFHSKDVQSICAYIFIISSYFLLLLYSSLRVDHYQMNLFLLVYFNVLYFTSSRLITWTVRIRSSQCLDHENPSCFLEKLHHFRIRLEPNTSLISNSSS